MSLAGIHQILASFGKDLEKIVSELDLEASAHENFLKADFHTFIKKSAAKNQLVWNELSPLVKSELYSGAKQLAREYGLEISSKKEFIQLGLVDNHLQEAATKFVQRTTTTDLNKFKSWIWNQENYPDLPLKDQPNISYILDTNKSRSERIDAVEGTRAQVVGGQLEMEENDYQLNEWATVGDDRVRPEHVLNNGVIVPIGSPFPNGEIFPGDTSINCRCHLEYIKISTSEPALEREPETGKPKSFGATISFKLPPSMRKKK